MHNLLRSALVAGLLAAATLSPAPAATPVYPWPKYSLVPILFVPRDWDVNSSEVQAEAAALNDAMVEIQQFYARALGGTTFALNAVQVVQGAQLKEAYGIHWNGGDIYADGVTLDLSFEGNIVAELHGRGYPTPPNQNEDGYLALMFVKGAGGYASGRRLKFNDGGWGILGDWAIDSIQGQLVEGQYPWGSGRRLQIAVTAKLLGITLTLLPRKVDLDGHIMGHFDQYPNVGFADDENDQLNRTRAQYFTQCHAITTPLPAPAVKPYEVVLLPTLGGDTRALHINEQGLISGFSETSPALPHQVLFGAGGTQIIDLGAGGGAHGAATGVNDTGTACGFWDSTSGERRATRSYFDAALNRYVTQELVQQAPDDLPVAYGINNSELIVGASRASAGQVNLWFRGSVRGAGLGLESLANAVNNGNQVAGTVVSDVGRRGFVWNDGNFDGIPQAGEWADIGVSTTIATAFSEALAINDRGEIAGSLDDGGLGHRYAFRLAPNPSYFADSGKGTNSLLSVLERLGRGPDYALGVNVHGAVVGKSTTCAGPLDAHATLWKDGSLIDLNDQVALPAGTTLVSADSINNAGHIVGAAQTPAGMRGFLLRPMIPPAPEPTTAAPVGHRIALAWNDLSSNESGFQIERAAIARGTPGAWTALITVAPNAVAYEDVTVTPGKAYQYRIRAYNDSGVSEYRVWPVVTARLNRSPVAHSDRYALREESVLTVAVAKGVLANDTDADGDPLTVVRIASHPSRGKLQWAPDGSFSYTPEGDFAGSDRFEYIVSDGVDQDRGVVSLKVSNVADAPDARDNKYTMARNKRLCVAAPGVLGNDRDADRDRLHAALDKGAESGRVQLERDGSFCYRPKSGFVGKDRFTYWAIDGTGRRDVGTVTIRVTR